MKQIIENPHLVLSSDFMSIKDLSGNISAQAAKNTGTTSNHIVPFFLKIFKKESMPLTEAIANTIVELDNLAKEIDSEIDTRMGEYQPLSEFKNCRNLEGQIVDCFSYLHEEPGLDELIKETLKTMEPCYLINTIERETAYNLRPNQAQSISTTIYLYPLCNYLTQRFELPYNVKSIFISISNYVQMFDDFLDLPSDIEAKIMTPVTKRLKELTLLSNEFEAFHLLSRDIQGGLHAYLRDIELEISLFSSEASAKMILENWYEFHVNVEGIPLPERCDLSERQRYLTRIREFAPPIVCYH